MAFIPVHNHTEFSALDGLSLASESAARAADCDSPAVAITDHGICSGHPEFQRACDAEGIKPLFGMETYFVPSRIERPAAGDEAAQKRLRANKHLILIARSDKGLQDLWALSTEAYRTGHYHKPRCDWELLERYGSELICTTACLGGIIADDLLELRTDAALRTLTRLRSIFGDRLYLEIQGNSLPQQKLMNQALLLFSDAAGIPLVAASDAHYATPGEAELHRLWMKCQAKGTPDSYWNYTHQQSEREVREALAYLDTAAVDQAIRSTELIAGQCDARIRAHADPPVFYGSYDEDSRALLDMCISNWGKLGPVGREYSDRLEREWGTVAPKHLAGCYLIVWDVINWARSQGALVGPGRGSAAGSLMSYLIGITAMDPIRTGLLFERFLTPGRVALPDFDMDFPSSWRPAIQDYVSRKYGDSKVVRVGTHMRYRSKGILNKLFSIMLPYEDESPPRIASIISEAENHTAGLGLGWDELMDEAGPQLNDYVQRYSNVFAMAAQLHGRLNSYGRHPAGLVISTSTELASALPMRLPEDSKDQMITQWDYRACEDMGLLKLDFLTLRTLDTISLALDLVQKRTGQRPSPPDWETEHSDPQVWDEIGTGATTGMFQIETSLGKDLCRRMKPRDLADMAAIVALVRPGPRNSGMTEHYLKRRRGDEEVAFPHPLLKEDLAASYGLMIYQEDVLRAVRKLGGYDDLEADGVRKILGKKLMEKIDEAGREFVARAHAYSGIELHDADAIWSDMAEFGRYGFNLAHAYAYGMLTYWCVGGQTRIYDWDKQQYVSIAKAYREGMETTACYDPVSGKTIPGKVSAVVRTTGAKNKDLKFGWRLTTASKKKLICSERHLILTPDGYKRLEEIEVGELVAAEKRHSASGREDVRRAIAGGVRRSWAMSTEESRKRQMSHLSDPRARDARVASWRERYEAKDPQQKFERVRLFIEAAADAAGRLGTAPCGATTHSPDEGIVCGWLMDNKIDHQHQVPLPSGKVADFLVKGVFVEVQSRTWQRSAEYWKQKYGDEAYILTDAIDCEDDLHWLLEEVPMRAGEDVTWDRVVSIEPVGDMVMYDIIMEGEPHNFLANGIVVHNTAWLKVHYPIETLTAILSTVDDMDRMPAFATEARRLGITILPPDVRMSGAGFVAEGLSIRYGLSSIKNVGAAAINGIVGGQPYASLQDFLERSRADSLVVRCLARAGALDPLVTTRRALVTRLEADYTGEATRCVFKDEKVLDAPNDLPCTFAWSAEKQPEPVTGKSGRPLKLTLLVPPKRCTRACRHYSPPALSPMSLPEYSPQALWQLEEEIYGTWMTPACFEQLDREIPGMRAEGRTVALLLPGAPMGIYTFPAVYAGQRSARTRSGNQMWWARLATEVSVIDTAVFSPRRDEDPDVPAMTRNLQRGTLVIATVVKDAYRTPAGSVRVSWRLDSLNRL